MAGQERGVEAWRRALDELTLASIRCRRSAANEAQAAPAGPALVGPLPIGFARRFVVATQAQLGQADSQTDGCTFGAAPAPLRPRCARWRRPPEPLAPSLLLGLAVQTCCPNKQMRTPASGGGAIKLSSFGPGNQQSRPPGPSGKMKKHTLQTRPANNPLSGRPSACQLSAGS